MGSGGVAGLLVGLLVGILTRVSGLAGVRLVGAGRGGAVGDLGAVAHLLVVVAELLLVGFVASLVSQLLHADHWRLAVGRHLIWRGILESLLVQLLLL